MNNSHFSMIPSAKIQRSVFDRSHGYKTTLDEGLLIPIMVDEMLPGDSFKVNFNTFGRLATPLVPFMDNVYMDIQAFFVPNRLVWDNWKKFNGEQKNPRDSTDYKVPKLESPETGFEVGSLGDYFGLPTSTKKTVLASELPFRAYALIWNEWYRDENLQDSVEFLTGDAPNKGEDIAVASGESPKKYANFATMKPLPRGKRHDYFTSCLPWPQKGDPVSINSAIVAGDGFPLAMTTFEGGTITASNTGMLKNWSNAQVVSYTTNANKPLPAKQVGDPIKGNDYLMGVPTMDQLKLAGIQHSGLSVSPITINDLREAFAIQRLMEQDARGGTRYTEIVRSHFGVVSPDARLQRPEYLGGSSTRININPVAQTSGTPTSGSDTPQGNLAAYGVFGDNGGFNYSATEHGYVIVLASIRADLNYQQGLSRMWSRSTRFEFYWPALANLGEQAVLNKEIYADGTANDDKVFGYQERWAEYRYFPSQITGKMRSTDPTPLDMWHLAQKFDACPTLSADFIEERPPIDRVIAVTDEPHFLLDVWFNMKCARPMPVYSVPGLSGHF